MIEAFMKYLKLIRLPNLLFIAIAQILIKLALFKPFGIATSLSLTDFILLVVATVSIAAGGNIINDIYDVTIDKINKPDKVIVGKSISEKSAYNLYFILNIIGVGIGFYLSNKIDKPSFSAVFIVISALLYLYASYFKSMLLLGNIIISALVAFSLIIVGIFDLFPAITEVNRTTQSTIFSIIIDYALFAFFLNFIREIVKDVQDIKGDINGGLNTLPIAIGKERTLKVVFILGIIAVFLVVRYMYLYLYNSQTLMLYFLLLVLAPLLYFCIQAFGAKTEKEISRLSVVLKIVLFFGMCSLALYPFVLK